LSTGEVTLHVDAGCPEGLFHFFHSAVSDNVEAFLPVGQAMPDKGHYRCELLFPVFI
jgi:hypothetical protein